MASELAAKAREAAVLREEARAAMESKAAAYAAVRDVQETAERQMEAMRAALVDAKAAQWRASMSMDAGGSSGFEPHPAAAGVDVRT